MGAAAEAGFQDPPRQRNRVWQMDFSEFETARGGIWRICAVIDYATKYSLAATVTPTSRGQDALGCLRRAVVEAERVLDLDDLRADRGVMDVVDADDYVIGEAPAPIAVVTDNESTCSATRTTLCDPTRPSTNAHQRGLPRRRTLRLACGLWRTRYLTGRS